MKMKNLLLLALAMLSLYAASADARRFRYYWRGFLYVDTDVGAYQGVAVNDQLCVLDTRTGAVVTCVYPSTLQGGSN